MKKRIWILAAILLMIPAALLIGLKAGAERRREHPAQSAEEIVLQLVTGYRISRASGDEATRKLLEELAGIDPDCAEKWQTILECWEQSGNNMAVNRGTLPEGLSDSPSLCFIVLGYALNPDGSMRPELMGRLQIAKLCADKYPNAYILCTGGGTAAASKVTEAEAMSAWLIENGVNAGRVLTEARSMTTTENAILSNALLEEAHPEITQAVLVSSDYHIPWAGILFQTEFTLSGSSVTLVGNAAYPTTMVLSEASLLRYQANGILEIAGEHR